MFGLFLKNPATPKIRLQCGSRAARIRSVGEIAKQALMTFARTRVTDRILFRIGGKAIETILNDDWILLKVIQRKKCTLAQDLSPTCLALQVILRGTNRWGLYSPSRLASITGKTLSKKKIQMARYKIIDDGGIYFTTHTVVEWLPIFREKRYFAIRVESLKYGQDFRR